MEMIVNDKRQIKSILLENCGYFYLNDDGITKIEAYGENGEMALVPWFAIWKGDNVIKRINGKYIIEVNY